MTILCKHLDAERKYVKCLATVSVDPKESEQDLLERWFRKVLTGAAMILWDDKHATTVQVAEMMAHPSLVLIRVPERAINVRINGFGVISKA
jgi:hypothetical protein